MSTHRHRRRALWLGLAVVAVSAATVAHVGGGDVSPPCAGPEDSQATPAPRDPPAIATASDSAPSFDPEAITGPARPTASPARDVVRPTSLIEGVVLDATDRPVAGVRVRARLAASDLGVLGAGSDADARPVAEATSSCDGGFRLSGEAGRWRVDAEAEGKALVTAPIVTAGATRDLVTLVLVDGARVRGRIAGPNGEPLASVRVRAVEARPDPTGAPTQAVRAFTATTDADGRYVLDGLPPHRSWRLSAGTPAGAWFESMVPLRVDAEATWNATIPDGVTVSGRVVARSDGAPVVDAHVWLQIVPEPDAAESNGPRLAAVAAATTDGDGRFRIDHVPLGVVAFTHVGAPGFAPWLALARAAGAESPRVDASGLAYPTIRLERGGRVVGRVDDLDGRARPGVLVSLVDEASAAVGTRSTLAEADGTYRFEGVASDHAFAIVAVEDAEPLPTCRLELHVADAGTLEHDVVVAPRRAAVPRGTSSVTGQVVDADDVPIDRALLVLGVGAPPSEVDVLLDRALSKTRSAPDGTFRFDAVPDVPDVYVCVVAAWEHDAYVEGSPSATARSIRADDRVTLRLGRSAPGASRR